MIALAATVPHPGPPPSSCLFPEAAALLRLTYVPEHRTKAIQALHAWVADQADEAAAVRRAKTACAGFIKSTGTEVVAEHFLPANFAPPTPKELASLHLIASMPVKPKLDTVPATKPNPPDRDPWLGFDIESAAELSAGQGAFMAYVQHLGVPVKWYAEMDDAAARVAARNVSKGAFRYRNLLDLNPADLPAVDLLVAGLSCQPFSLAGLRLAWRDTRTDTFFATMLIAACMQPKALILENVAAIFTSAKGRIWRFIKGIALQVGYEAKIYMACASEWAVPQVRQRAFIFMLRQDIAKRIGMPLDPKMLPLTRAPAPGLGVRTLELFLLPWRDVAHLAVPNCKSRIIWVRNPDLTAAPLSACELTKPVVVAFIDAKGLNTNKVFVNFIPAIKATASGLGAYSHLVAQQCPSGEFVARHLHIREVMSMQDAPELGISLHFPAIPELTLAGIGNSCPARLALPYMQAFIQHCKPISTFRPRSLAEIGLPHDRLHRWQSNMKRGAEDHAQYRRNGDIDCGQKVVNDRPRHKRTMSTTMSVFPVAMPECARHVVWFTADAIAENDPTLIVPVQRWRSVQSNFNTKAIEMLAVGFRDKMVLFDLMFGTQIKNDEHSNQAHLGPNHWSGEREWRLVDEAFQADFKAGRALKFKPEHCPHLWPCFVHPTGSVPKTLRDGSRDLSCVRPTSDLSAPCSGMEWFGIITAVNDSIDLERDFPKCKYFSWEEFARRAITMKASGETVLLAVYDMASWYSQIATSVSAYATHTRYWAREDGAYLYNCLSLIFGCRAAASIATRTSAFVVYLFQLFAEVIKPKSPGLQRWFDLLLWARQQGNEGNKGFADFAFYPSSGSAGEFVDDLSCLAFESQAESLSAAMLAVLEYLGMMPQSKKIFSEGKFQVEGKVLGININLDTMIASIPPDKIAKALARIKGVSGSRSTSYKPLEELLGILQWIGQVLVRAGVHLPFTICALKAAYARPLVRVSSALRAELAWWSNLLSSWNGRAMIIDPVWVVSAHTSDLAPFTDASRDDGKGGGGAIFLHYFYACLWTKLECKHFTIYELEGFMYVLWIQWITDNVPHLVTGKRFITRCDNMSFCDASRRGRSSYPCIDWLLRQLHTLQSKFSFELDIQHVPGVLNIASDAASRGYWDVFFKNVKEESNFTFADMVQVQIPQRNTWSLKLLSLKLSEKDTQLRH